MAGREVTSEDGPLLEAFRCADPAREWEGEVEDAVHNSLLWISERSGRAVRIYELDGVPAVVVGYEFVSPVSEEEGFYLPFLAVASEFQADELASDALDDIMVTLREESFGGPVTCKIDVRNVNSQKLFRRHGFVIVEGGSDNPRYQLWRAGS